MYVGTTEAAEISNISTSRMRYLVAQGRVKGAYKVGRFWIIPLFNGMPIISRGSRGPKAKWCRRIPAKTKIHVNKHKILENKNQNQEDLVPVLTVKRYDSNIYGYSVKVNGPCEVVYRPEKPLDCGAVVWIETYSQVAVECTKSKQKGKQEDRVLVNAA